MDLVAPSDEGTWVARHVLDALGALEALPADVGDVVDVGSGAGFPGLVWACARPGLRVVLCEARQRRAAFLRAARRELSLDAAEVVEGRAEALPAGAFSAAVSRAALPYSRWLPAGARLVRPGGCVLALLGPADPEGLGEAEAAAGLACERVHAYRPAGRERRVVELRKVG